MVGSSLLKGAGGQTPDALQELELTTRLGFFIMDAGHLAIIPYNSNSLHVVDGWITEERPNDVSGPLKQKNPWFICRSIPSDGNRYQNGLAHLDKKDIAFFNNDWVVKYFSGIRGYVDVPYISQLRHITTHPQHADHQKLLRYLYDTYPQLRIDCIVPKGSVAPDANTVGIGPALTGAIGAAGAVVAFERAVKLAAINTRLKKTTDKAAREQLLRMRRIIQKHLAAAGAVGVAGAVAAFVLYKKKKRDERRKKAQMWRA